jgi:quercetin dioxygenase-like cupin family protein
MVDPVGMTLRGLRVRCGESLEDLNMGVGSVLSLKVTGEESNGLVTVIEGLALAGGPPLHLHEAEDEVVICLNGELAYQVGDHRGTLEPGGVLWFPRSVPHAVANLSDEPVRFITVVTPSGIEDFFRAQRDYLASHSTNQPIDPTPFGSVAGSESRPTVGPPLT